MKVALLISVCYFISATNALTLQKIEGINDLVQEVNFVSDGNIYAGLDNYLNRHELYKLSPSKEVLWKIDYSPTFGTLWNSLVTSRNELYLHFFNSNARLYPLAILQPGSTEIQQVEDDFVDFLFALDGSDDLLYLRQDGIFMLRPNSTTPIAVKNLEDGFIFNKEVVEIDKSGNLYIGLLSGKVAVISKESQQDEIPSARFLSDSDPTEFYTEDVAIDKDDNLWTVSTDGKISNFKKLKDDVLEIVATDKNYGLHRLLPAKDKIFVLADYPITEDRNASIFYLNSNGEIATIPELENINLGAYVEDNGVADGDGNAYFHATKDILSESLGPLVLVNSDGKVVPIDLDISGSVIDFVKLDFNEDVWIKTSATSGLTEELFRLKKGDTIPEKINISAGSTCGLFMRDLYVNKVTKEVYVSCTDGLNVVVEE